MDPGISQCSSAGIANEKLLALCMFVCIYTKAIASVRVLNNGEKRCGGQRWSQCICRFLSLLPQLQSFITPSCPLDGVELAGGFWDTVLDRE